MPIRPENVLRYPREWAAISWAIRWLRALGQCECHGACGRVHLSPTGRCTAHNGGSTIHGAAVVLTVAHLDHTPENCHPANLRAMCQGCHLRYDRDHHAQTARRTRQLTRQRAGIRTLFALPEED